MSKLYNRRIKGILKEIEEIKTNTLHALYKELNDAKRNLQITCEECKKKTAIKNITYIQTHWYTRPHGCTGGDYWNQGEGNFICPKCGARNRLYNRAEWEEFKHYFKDVEDEYEKVTYPI